MRIGVDVMGGDNAPQEVVRGAVEACALLEPDDRVVLVGDEAVIRAHLKESGGGQERIDVHHADQVITMDEKPIEALRNKPDSSIAVLAEMQRDDLVDACVSAGNTGACVAAAQMRLRRLRGVHRPGIAIVAPTFHGPVAICDVGANVNCRPQHLHQYGLMASIYLNAVCDVADPRVALMSIGEEDAKGNDLVKQTHQLMKDDTNIRFVGNAEGRDLFRGVCDVMICDGFVGNVVLKLMEGMAGGIIRGMLRELATSLPDQAQLIRKSSADIVNKYDFNQYGGAPLLGVGGIWIICHGASSHRGIMNAVRQAKNFAKQQVNEQITAMLSQS